MTDATLPASIAAFDGLGRVEAATQYARKLFFIILAACVYSWLTIAMTTDAGLLTNTASSPLPIIGTTIPIVGFYWVDGADHPCVFHRQVFAQARSGGSSFSSSAHSNSYVVGHLILPECSSRPTGRDAHPIRVEVRMKGLAQPRGAVCRWYYFAPFRC